MNANKMSVRNLLEADEREAKLPKWVQADLNLLRLRLREATERNEEFGNRTDPAKSQVVIDPFVSTPLHLPEGTTVRFITDRNFTHSYVDIRVRKFDGNRIYINGGNRLSIRPEVSNAFTVEVEK